MFHTGKIRAILAGFGLLAAGVTMPAAVAANDSAPDRTPLIMAQDTAFEQDVIEAFAAAQLRIVEIRDSFLPQFQAAETDEQREQINQKATQEMIEAVESTPNLTLEDYNAISAAAGQDPTLAERIGEAMAELST